MTPGRLWLEFRRDLKRGPSSAWHHRMVAPHITRWRPPNSLAPAGPVTVHVVGGRDHLLLGAWMLASWLTQTGRRWNIVWHEDGSVPLDREPLKQWMAEMLAVNFIPRDRADEAMRPILEPYPRLAAMRERLPLMLKLLDTVALTSSQRCLLVDPDVLFFQRPAELLDWVDSTGQPGEPDPLGCWFNQEAEEPNYLPADKVREELGFELWPGFNSGLGATPTKVIDFEFCEQLMARYPELQGTEFWQNWRVEQTLMGLCCSRHNRGGMLPGEIYEVHRQRRRNPKGITRHYIGAVRDRFWGEGVKMLKTQLQRPKQ